MSFVAYRNHVYAGENRFLEHTFASNSPQNSSHLEFSPTWSAWLPSIFGSNTYVQRSRQAKVLKMAATRCRNLENLLKFKPRSREKRKRLYKNLVTALVQYERVETTINRCHDLSRVAERVSPCKIALKWICMGNSLISCDIWHKYHEWYFEIVIRTVFIRL